MPAAVTDEPKEDERSEQMWKVLKVHIMRERARKKQEREAEVEEERLRKEREAREQQNVMTLGETREQILELELKLQKLKEEKHQLFLQLKKVLNEDDNRRRQLVKENNEVLAIQSLPSGLVHQQLYISPNVSRNTPISQPSTFKGAVKRPRSPSPQPTPVSSYHPNYGYKTAPVGNTGYQSSPQKDDGRRNEFVRAVLWNKAQYPGNHQTGAFYHVPPPPPPQELPAMYYPMGSLPSREPPPRSVYDPAPPPPPPAPRPQQAYTLEPKMPDHYSMSALRAPSSHAHVIHTNSMAAALSPAPPPAKAGSITAGYPVRSQPQYQQQSGALYTTQSRPLYQASAAPINYPPRD